MIEKREGGWSTYFKKPHKTKHVLNYGTGGEFHRLCIFPAAAGERAAIPLLLDWADYAQVSAAAKKADYLCPNRVVSLETQDAIISMGRIIIEDQAHVTVRCMARDETITH